jgi:hypothetical protein
MRSAFLRLSNATLFLYSLWHDSYRYENRYFPCFLDVFRHFQLVGTFLLKELVF